MVPASEAPPLYADHPDRERIEKLPVLSSSEFTGWEPVDIIDLADAGEKLLDTHGSWIHAVEPLVRELECVMRGQPSSVEQQSYDLAVRYLGELRRQLCGLIGILDAGDLPTDFAIGVRLQGCNPFPAFGGRQDFNQNRLDLIKTPNRAAPAAGLYSCLLHIIVLITHNYSCK